MKTKQRWNNEEDSFIIENYERIGAKACATKLQKTLSSIYSRAERKSLVWLDDYYNDTIYPVNTMFGCATCED